MTTQGEDPLDRLPVALDYSWKWFSYHAQQRLTAFNFYLIIVGALVVGYLKCLEEGWRWIGAAIAVFGVLISFAFWLLDIRNTELVNCGREALDTFEPEFGLHIREKDNLRTLLRTSANWPSHTLFRSTADDDVRPWVKLLTTHQWWLRTIIILGLLSSALGVLWTIPDIGFHVHSARTRFESEYILRRVDRMMTLLSQLDSASKETPVTQGTVRIIRDSALTLGLLSQEVAADCRLQRYVHTACKDFRKWLATAMPVFQKLSGYDGAAVSAETTPSPRDIMNALDPIVDSLRSALPNR